jgi:hypothetical protein
MSKPPLEPVRQLGEQFHAAAARRVADERRARRRRGVIAAVAAVVATGGAAAATQLISTGTPAKDSPLKPNQRYAPTKLGQLAVTADDPAFPLPWGVVIYRAKGGEQCALLGQARGPELGRVTGGVFHPFERRAGGACGDIAHVPYFFDHSSLNGRTLLYGRARRDVASIRVRLRGEPTRTAATGPGGAFLFVFKGKLELGGGAIAALDRDGKPLD